MIKGTPDYEDETIVEGPIDYSGEYDYENYWYDGILDWKAVVHYSYEVVGYQSIKSYVAKWNSPQPTYNGKLVAIWNDGFTATFSVSLSPVLIEKSYDEGYSNIEEASFSLVQEFYWFDAENDQWVYDRTETESDSYSGSGTYGSSTLIIQFSTKIQSKGRPPIQGGLSLWEQKYMTDTWQQSSLSVNGDIGPYYIDCHSSSYTDLLT